MRRSGSTNALEREELDIDGMRVPVRLRMRYIDNASFADAIFVRL